MTDVFDRASQLETEERERLIAARLNRPAEQPDEDEHGRYCLDCGDTLPRLRVTSVNAVRCVECQQGKEHREAVRVGHRY